MKNIITVTGIRPDFIRMSEIFKKLDLNFNHILIHTGQHFDKMLSDVFFDELEIRKPDYNLEIGGLDKEHYHQSSELDIKLITLIKNANLNPDLIIFLGDSNSVASAVSLKKEGYKIAHIEAGMRSGDKRMLEEINRTVCDHCSDYHFVYHNDYKENLIAENLPAENIFVVGNTIVEVMKKNTVGIKKSLATPHILLDIHRPENFKYSDRLISIIHTAMTLSEIYDIPVYLLKFKRTMKYIIDFNINLHNIKLVELMSYKDFLEFQLNSKFIISDSGTAQEEPALLGVPVIVPRDYTERPQSMTHNCSLMIPADINKINSNAAIICNWLDTSPNISVDWLGSGDTSSQIIEILKNEL